MVLSDWPTPYPSGQCWCGCKDPIGRRSLDSAHDRKAESMLIRMHYGSIADIIAAHGYGPDEEPPRGLRAVGC